MLPVGQLTSLKKTFCYTPETIYFPNIIILYPKEQDTYLTNQKKKNGGGEGGGKLQ